MGNVPSQPGISYFPSSNLTTNHISRSYRNRPGLQRNLSTRRIPIRKVSLDLESIAESDEEHLTENESEFSKSRNSSLDDVPALTSQASGLMLTADAAWFTSPGSSSTSLSSFSSPPEYTSDQQYRAGSAQAKRDKRIETFVANMKSHVAPEFDVRIGRPSVWDKWGATGGSDDDDLLQLPQWDHCDFSSKTAQGTESFEEFC